MFILGPFLFPSRRGLDVCIILWIQNWPNWLYRLRLAEKTTIIWTLSNYYCQFFKPNQHTSTLSFATKTTPCKIVWFIMIHTGLLLMKNANSEIVIIQNLIKDKVPVTTMMLSYFCVSCFMQPQMILTLRHFFGYWSFKEKVFENYSLWTNKQY